MFKTLVLLTTITLTIAVPTKPTLRHDGGSAHYTAINPLLQPIEMRISCTGEFAPVIVAVAARTQEELEIKQPDGRPALCFLDAYRELK